MSNETGRNPISQYDIAKRRGLQVYTLSQIISQTGRDEKGGMVTWGVEQPYFFLTAMQRNEIFKLSTPVFGIVTSRMNKIAGLDFNVVPLKKQEDQIADSMKNQKQVFDEYKTATDLKYVLAREKIRQNLIYDLPELLPDLSNFNACLLRWKKRIVNNNMAQGDEIKEWLMEPNNGVTWTAYIKKFVSDLMIHGVTSVYKQYQQGANGQKRLDNFDTLPGGTVYRFKAAYFSGVDGYIQLVAGYEPQIFYANECMYVPYLPTSFQNYPLVPLEALINKIAEGLLFDRLMAEQADGTKPPEKVAIVTEGNKNPFGDLEGPENIPVDSDEQKRIESKMNEPRKGAIMSFSGNDVKVIDLSRENTMGVQNERQKDIRQEVALVFNMSNSEINMMDSEGLGGKSTSETQQEIEQGKGTTPIVRLIEEAHTKNIIPFRFGYGWKLEVAKEKNETEKEQVDTLRLNNGKVTVNELREEDGMPTFDDEQFDLPRGTQPAQPGESQINPIHMKQV